MLIQSYNKYYLKKFQMDLCCDNELCDLVYDYVKRMDIKWISFYDIMDVLKVFLMQIVYMHTDLERSWMDYLNLEINAQIVL